MCGVEAVGGIAGGIGFRVEVLEPWQATLGAGPPSKTGGRGRVPATGKV